MPCPLGAGGSFPPLCLRSAASLAVAGTGQASRGSRARPVAVHRGQVAPRGLTLRRTSAILPSAPEPDCRGLCPALWALGGASPPCACGVPRPWRWPAQDRPAGVLGPVLSPCTGARQPLEDCSPCTGALMEFYSIPVIAGWAAPRQQIRSAQPREFEGFGDVRPVLWPCTGSPTAGCGGRGRPPHRVSSPT